MANPEQQPIRTLIVDDSRIYRGHLQEVLERIPGIQVVGSVFSGEKAVEFLRSHQVDLVTLDIQMPGMDGLATLREIKQLARDRRIAPGIAVILVSVLTRQGARVTIEGLQAGAFDYVAKPEGDGLIQNLDFLQRSLSEKIEILRHRPKWHGSHELVSSDPNPARVPSSKSQPTATPPTSSGAVLDSMTAGKRTRIQAIAIGISTGGPEALGHMLPNLAEHTQKPIFIVQHILHGMSQYLAEGLSKKTCRKIIEVEDGLEVLPGGIYMARSGQHMLIRHQTNQWHIGLSDAPPECNSKPSVDVFLRSAALAYGPALLATIMTGMGNDGAAGIVSVKRAGGFVLAQDEATSIVWGMPSAAIATGCVDRIVSLQDMANAIIAER